MNQQPHMRKNTTNLLIVLIMTCLLATSALAIPGTWKGYVTISGSNASLGSFVAGYVNSIQAQNKTTGDPSSAPANYYILDMEGASGQSVTFKVFGISVNEAAQSWSEGIHQLDLTMTPASSGGACQYGQSWSTSGCTSGLSCCSDNTCKSSCTSSSSGGGGGGGGGGGSSSGGAATGSSCTESWACAEWSECAEGTQTRSCLDRNDCGTTVTKPAESKSCTTQTTETPTGGEPQPPSEAGGNVGEIRDTEGTNWKWSGTTWVREGTPEYEQLPNEGNLITGAAQAVLEAVEFNTPLFIGMIIAVLAVITLYVVLSRRKKR